VASPRTPSLAHDLEIPAEQLAEWIGTSPEPAILESGPGFGSAGRWSVFSARPRLVFEAVGSSWMIRKDGETIEAGRERMLERLARLIHQFQLADPSDIPDPGQPPFHGGLIGFFGYDLAPELERLPRKAVRDSCLPDVRFALYDTAVIVDHLTGSVRLHAFDILGEGRDTLARRVCEWSSNLVRSTVPNAREPLPLEKEASGGVWPRPGPRRDHAFTPANHPFSRGGVVEVARERMNAASRSFVPGWNFTRREYLAAVQKCLDYIAAGDIFQANLSRRFSTGFGGDPLELYLRLRSVSPAPFSAYLRTSEYAVVSASPESFYETRGDRIITRPIKGTRRRDESPEADARLVRELAESPKDRAELTMIVDLERNDLGRVCQYGSVHVVDALKVESFAQVHHLVATVEGKIRPGVGPIDVVRALFPGGSITGAPKIRAMEILDELEPTRRSLYTGAIGYLSRGGTSAFNIVIRTMLVEPGRLTYQVGGGIVADSDPESEYEETIAKARGLRAVLESMAIGSGP
jgi:para-aminobenzoate synthetase component 1